MNDDDFDPQVDRAFATLRSLREPDIWATVVSKAGHADEGIEPVLEADLHNTPQGAHPRPSRRSARLAAGLLLVAVTIAALVVVARRPSPAPPRGTDPSNALQIDIVSIDDSTEHVVVTAEFQYVGTGEELLGNHVMIRSADVPIAVVDQQYWIGCLKTSETMDPLKPKYDLVMAIGTPVQCGFGSTLLRPGAVSQLTMTLDSPPAGPYQLLAAGWASHTFRLTPTITQTTSITPQPSPSPSDSTATPPTVIASTGIHPDLTLPSTYVGARSDPSGNITIDQFSPTGEDLGTLAQRGQPQSTPSDIPLGDGRRIRHSVTDRNRCRNDPLLLVATDDTTTPLHPELPEATSVVALPSGFVVATRDVCPPGTTWGDSGTRWELVSIDLAHPERGVTMLADRQPDLAKDPILYQQNDFIYALGDSYLRSISPDGRYVGLDEPYSSETARTRIRDLTKPQNNLDVPSACDNARDLVGGPVFLPDGSVIVARFCGPDDTNGDVHIEQVRPNDNSVPWSARLNTPLIPNYTMALDIRAALFDDGPWVIVNGDDVERPTTSIVLHLDQQRDISRAGYDRLAFTLEDLIP